MNDLNSSRKLAARTRPGVLLALFLLAGLPALVTPLRADNPPTYLFQWGSGGSGNGQFEIPYGIAIDSSNNVYVADAGNSRVEKFASNGTYLTQWGSVGSGNGQLNFPQGIAVDSNNNVYVVDEDNTRVEKFNSNGTLLMQLGGPGFGNGQFDEPKGIAVDSSNNVYVVDSDIDRVQKFDSNGNYLTQWGSQGFGNGQLNSPQGIAVDSSNNVYVADSQNNRVEKFESNGNYLTQWGSDGNGNGQFDQPQGIAVDSSNNVYVVDEGNGRVEKFESNGNYLTQWGSGGNGNGQFSNSEGIAVDSTGNFIYIVDSGNDRIQVFVNNPNIVAPIIISQPANQTVPAGANVTFSVGVIGTAPFAYQWSSNSIAISSATNATFTLTDVSFADSASYSVLVTNSYGSTLSSNAVLAGLPAVVMTQPASSVTTTGAVLNGSVTVASDETVVWFEWGADTNYGNIAGETIVPGNNASNSISTVLNALPGNIYHYRIDATNDFGIAYGNDQSFVVGSAPTATSLAAVVSTNGATLNATVNPNGWDTTVHFAWQKGTSTYDLTNSTPAVDIGAGAAPLNVGSFITGLSPAASYTYQVVASNHLGIVYAGVITFLSAPFASVPPAQWTSVAVSADGTKLAAGGTLYTSTNSGVTWSASVTPFGQVKTIASSVDGTKLISGPVFLGYMYISTNSGESWAPATNAPKSNWSSISSSADGTKLAAVPYPDVAGLYTSTNSGVDWTQQTNGLPPYTKSLTCVASSADGSKLVAAVSAGPIFTSTNFGVNWIQATNAPSTNWLSVASSADGKTLLASASGEDYGFVYVSSDAGIIWTKTSLPTSISRMNWDSVAESADGTKMVALANSGSLILGSGNGGIFTSTNSGATWVSNTVPSAAWTCAAMSADGNEIIATIGSPSGGIYVSQTTPAPSLTLSATNNTLISWLIPSMNFTLQQSPDLMNWSDVTNPPALNLTNLQNQVALPPPDGNSFFRLMH